MGKFVGLHVFTQHKVAKEEIFTAALRKDISNPALINDKETVDISYISDELVIESLPRTI